MGDIRKVIVNGEEFEVELDQDGDTWTAVVAGETFEISVPDAGPAPKQRRSSGGKSKKSGKVSETVVTQENFCPNLRVLVSQNLEN